MNPFRLLVIATLLAVPCLAQLPPNAAVHIQSGGFQPSTAQQPTPPKELVNYIIRVEWKDGKRGTNALQVVTIPGSFELDTVSGAVKINDSDVPTTVKVSGQLVELSPEKGRLQLFLGRTVPYVTSSAGSGPSRSSSYSQLSVGLQSNFMVTFGKPLVIQTDDNGQVILLVKRADD